MAATAKKTKHSKLSRVEINPGVHQVWPDPDGPNASKNVALEIIAIPGLGADPTWTWKRGDVNWLSDRNMLSRKVQDVRISVFQYQNQWFGKGSIDQNLDSVANQLLHFLERSRGDNCKVPIIFVSHCLGGIVLEKALLTARLHQDDYPSIFPCVAGCIFLGTPFRGTSTQSKAIVLAEMAKTLGVGEPSSLLKLLEKDSEKLLEILHDFIKLANHSKIRVVCFYESEESDVAALFRMPFKSKELIVDRHSAVPPGIDNLQLKSDHFGLNKFSGTKDGNYTMVSNEIQVTAKRAAGIINSRQKAFRNPLVDDRTCRAIIAHLGKGFSDFDSTMKGNYKALKSDKFSWILDFDNFKSWNAQQASRLLWIHGKAGTGQSSIASFVLESLIQTKDDGSIVASFFCDQGDENRRSLSSLLRLLIRQIIDINQNLASHLLTEGSSSKAGSQEYDPELFSKVPYLWDSLLKMARDLPSGCMYLVLNGIEQLSSESLRDLLQIIMDIPNFETESSGQSRYPPIQLILLSRSGRPEILKALKPKALEINLNNPDIADNISDALRQDISARVSMLNLPAPIAYFVKCHIHSRAEDNYIYPNLAIQELKNARASGMIAYSETRVLLESFPYGLTEMYAHIRKRILNPGAEGIEYTKEILRCRMLALRAPTLRELAVMADLPLKDRNSVEQLKGYIIRCGAFLTLRGSELDENNMSVEWIDISAQEHLEKNAKDDLALELKEMQHGIIALRCLNYCYTIMEKRASKKAHDLAENEEQQIIKAKLGQEEQLLSSATAERKDDISETLEASQNNTNRKAANDQIEPSKLGDTVDPDSSSYSSDIGNALTYAAQYWVEHAKLAPSDVIDDFDTDHPFWADESPTRQDWWSETKELHSIPNQTNVSALHLATIMKFPALAEHLLNHGRKTDLHKEDSLGFQPLYYASLRGDYETVDILLKAGADRNAVSYKKGTTALYGAAIKGHRDVVELLLDRGADIGACSGESGSALYGAATEDRTEVLQFLLERGAKVNTIGGRHKRALNWAAYNGNLASVQTLIDYGADIDPDEPYTYGSALGAAARRGHVGVVRFLLGKGWSPTKHINPYGSFLTTAATYGHLSVVEALIETNPPIKVLEQALRVASRNENPDIVKTILDHTPTLQHHQAFMIAADYGRNEVLKLLWPRGIPQSQLDTALYTAADHEHEKTVKLLLEFGADPNAEGSEYGTALTASAYDGTKGILRALLEKKADPNKVGGEYGTALQAAAYFGDVSNVKLLIEHGAKVNTDPIGTYGNPLQAACYTGYTETIKALLDEGADINARGGHYNYAIIAAADEGSSECVRLLLEHKANVNVRGLEDNEPLIAIAGSTLPEEDLKIILKAGADINAQCDRGTSALINCADACDAEGLKFLLAHGADIKLSSESLGTALHAAAAEGDAECCEVLIKAGADVNAIGGPYGTALQAAAWGADIDTVKVLLQAHADVNLISGEYGTALQAGASEGDVDIVRELLDHGADVNQLGGKYGCALQAAAVAEKEDVVELLIDSGADVNLKGGLFGFSLLGAAAQWFNNEIVQTLLDHGADATVQGGQLGSAAQAAAYGNTAETLETLIKHGANVHAKGGKYGDALQAAAVKADLDIIEILLEKGADATYRGGKYETALQAAAYADKLDIVEKLIDHGADFRIQGGKYGNALSAAAIRGHKNVVLKFLKMSPPAQMLDTALVEACYHRQSAIVEVLLKAGADLQARHPTLGLPVDAIGMEAPEDENSDDEDDDSDDDEDEDEDDYGEDEDDDNDEGEEDEDDDDDDDGDGDDDEEDEEDEEEQSEGDDESVGGATEGSVTDLKLEEETTDEIKIQKLLKDEAMVRVKRNPSFKRSKTVRGRQIPSVLTAGPQPQLSTTSYTQFNPPPTRAAPQYDQQQHPQRQTFQAYPGSPPSHGPQGQQGYAPPVSSPDYMPYRSSMSGIPPAQSRTSQLGADTSLPKQPPSSSYVSSPPPPQQQQYANTRLPSGYGTPPAISPSPSTQDIREQARSGTGSGSPGRYEQYQHPPGELNRPSAQVPQRRPVPGQYTSPPQSSYNPQSQPQHQYSTPPSIHSPYQQTPTSQPTSRQSSYQTYASPSSSQTSFQSSQYAQNSQPGGGQSSSGQQRYRLYDSPNSSQTTGWGASGTEQQQGQGWGQGNRWKNGGYEGEGYG